MFDDDQNPKLITITVYALLGGSMIAWWGEESVWLSTSSVVWTCIFFALAVVALWDWWRVRETNLRYHRAKAIKEEASAALMRDYPAVYMAERIAGMNERQVEALMVVVLPLYEDGDAMAADLAKELSRKYGLDATKIDMTVEDEAKVYLREAAKHHGQMRPQDTVSGEKRRRLQRVLEYLQSQDVIERPLYNQPVNIDWNRVGELGLLGKRQEAM